MGHPNLWLGQFDMRRWMQPVDTNWPGFQPLGCGSIGTQGFALGWYRSAPLALVYAPLALEAIPGVDLWGASQLRLFLKLTHFRQEQRRRRNTGISPLRRQSAPPSVEMTFV